MTLNPATIHAGDWLVPDSIWNNINESRHELPDPVRVIAAKNYGDSFGYAFLVRMKGGDSAWLHSSYFTAKVPAPEGSQ